MESKQQSHKSQRSRENKNDTNRKMTGGKRIKVFIVGDSNLRNVKEEKLSNDYRDVEIRFKPGMRIEEANKKVVVNKEFDVIIVHAGTNNLRDATSKDLTEKIVTTLDRVQKSNPTAYSQKSNPTVYSLLLDTEKERRPKPQCKREKSQ